MISARLLPTAFTPGTDLFRGRNLLVTGAHTDLGRIVATALASQGATLLLTTRKERLLGDLYDTLVAENHPEPLLITMDLARASEEELHRMTDGLKEMVGAVHGIVHLGLSASPLSSVTLSQTETWKNCLHQLFWQPLQLVRAMIPLLLDAEDPSVLFHTLPCGRQGKAYWGPLGSALSSLENLSQTLADEHPSIRFNTLDIGPVNSDLRRRFYPAESRSVLKPLDDPSVINGFLQLVSGAGNLRSGEAFRIP